MKIKIRRTMLMLLSVMLYTTPVMSEVVIIAHPSSGASEIDAKLSKKLYMGKVTTIPGMTYVALIGQTDASPTKAAFSEKVVGKGLNKYNAYWSEMIFSGKAIPPKELANDAEVRAYVASHFDAVGYVDAGIVDDSVKVLFRVR